MKTFNIYKVLLILLFFVSFKDPAVAQTFIGYHDFFSNRNPPGAALALSLPRKNFLIGERIPITLDYSIDVSKNYFVDPRSYDRSGRLGDMVYVVDGPPENYCDPLAEYYVFGSGFGGGLSSVPELKQRVEQTFDLNEWVRFDKPGTYRLFCLTTRLGPGEHRSEIPWGVNEAYLCSQVIEIHILPMTPDFEDSVVKDANKLLESSDVELREKGVRELRFLGTQKAIDLLVPLVTEHSNVGVEAALGIAGSRDWGYAKKLMTDGFLAPDTVVDENYLWLLTLLSIPKENFPYVSTSLFIDEAIQSLEKAQVTPASTVQLSKQKGIANTNDDLGQIFDANHKEYIDLLKKNLSQKRGKALGEAVAYIALSIDGKGDTAYCDLLAEHFEDLSDHAKTLLYYRLDSFHCAEMKKYLLEAIQKPRGAVSGLNWFDEEKIFRWLIKNHSNEARRLILADIAKPNHRYSAEALSTLPEKTLPQLDKILVSNFETSEWDINGTNALLIERYASPKALSSVVHAYLLKEGRWPCDVQENLLRYWIQNDRKNGLASFQRVMKGLPGIRCNESLCSGVLDKVYSPAAEKVLLNYLDDPNRIIRLDVINVIRERGSALALERLLERLETSRQILASGQVVLDDAEHHLIVGTLANAQNARLTKNQWARLNKCLRNNDERVVYKEGLNRPIGKKPKAN